MKQYLPYPLIVIVILTLTFFSTGNAAASPQIPVSETSIEVFNRLFPTLAKNLAKKGQKLGSPAFIRIFKEEGDLELWLKRGQHYSHYKTYTICDYSGNLGPKIREGDKQSPEGFYNVTPAQLNPWSKYHLSFNLGFPNEYDQLHSRTGSGLMIHGRCSSAGCYAMTDFRMEEIYSLVNAALAKGQQHVQVHIFPFRMTEDNLHRHSQNRWLSFWMNLKEGYDLFERDRNPPEVYIRDRRYAFSASLLGTQQLTGRY